MKKEFFAEQYHVKIKEKIEKNLCWYCRKNFFQTSLEVFYDTSVINIKICNYHRYLKPKTFVLLLLNR